MSKTRLKEFVAGSKPTIKEDEQSSGLSAGEFIIRKACGNTSTFWFDDSDITSLSGIPRFMNGKLRFQKTSNTDCTGMPEEFDNPEVDVMFSDCGKLTSLNGITKNIRELEVVFCENVKDFNVELNSLSAISIKHCPNANLSGLKCSNLSFLNVEGVIRSEHIPNMDGKINAMSLIGHFTNFRVADELSKKNIKSIDLLFLENRSNGKIDFDGINKTLKFEHIKRNSLTAMLYGDPKNHRNISQLLTCSGIKLISFDNRHAPSELTEFCDNLKFPVSRADLMNFAKLCDDLDLDIA